VSSAVYPVLPGLQWPVVRSIVTETTRRRTASGRSFRTTSWTYPVLRYRLSYEFLRRSASFTEYQQLAAFFVQMLGGYDNFLYTDPTDSAVTNQIIGTGDGTTRDFALLFPIGAAAVPIGAVNGSITVTLNGTTTSAYTLLDSRVVRFNTAPGAGVVIRWTGAHYMRCFFTDDVLDLEEFMSGFHSADGVEFETEKG
jgi:hypothetical protein